MTDELIGTPFDRLVIFNQKFLKEQHETCVNYEYSAMIEELQETSKKSPAAQFGGKIYKKN